MFQNESKIPLCGINNVFQNPSVKDHNETELWRFWFNSVGMESPVWSSESDMASFSECANESFRNGCGSPHLNPMKLSCRDPPLGPMRRPFRSPQLSPMKGPFQTPPLFSPMKMPSQNPHLSSTKKPSRNPPLSSMKRRKRPFRTPHLGSMKAPSRSPLMTSDQKPASCNWSRSGKPQRVQQVKTSKSRGKPWCFWFRNRGVKSSLSCNWFRRAKLRCSRYYYEDIMSSSVGKLWNFWSRIKGIKCSVSSSWFRRAKIQCTKYYYDDTTSSSLDKANYAPDSPKFFRELQKTKGASINGLKSVRLKKRKQERMPSHPSVRNIVPQKTSETCFPDAATNKTNIPEKCSGKRIQKWNMVVDTTALLTKKSRKALQFLEGLMGTKLIIPYIVMKNLAYMNQQVSFVRECTEVSLALKWIKDCMAKTPSWIHVQNPTEEGQSKFVASKNPASKTGSFPFSSVLEPPPELLLPTVGDHVLECALSFRRNNNDENLVLLSSDATLKMKAIAVGIICETVEEFSGSLVNQFFDSFLQADA